MSFSSDIKSELLSNMLTIQDQHCKIAELEAIINICGYVSADNCYKFIVIHSDNIDILKLAIDLIADIFNITINFSNNEIVIKDSNLVDNMIRILGIKDSNDFSLNAPINPKSVVRNCCKRAYIRTAFVCCGSVNDPSKHYHLEFADNDYEHSKNL